MKHDITVLQDDIDKAKELHENRKSDPFYMVSARCPIALAVQREFLGHLARAGGRMVEIYHSEDYRSGIKFSASGPPEMAKFINDFDSGLPVEPFKFEIEIPD